MASGISGSLYDLSGNQIEDTYGRVAQIIPGGGGVNETRTLTPTLYDGYGNQIQGLKMQEAFERDSNNDLQPTTGPFLDMFWEEDSEGNKMPRDMKFWLDAEYNMILLPNQ
tara:strand:+ start:1006 stop:1338 length:333 start_codon:yes stop_codon:yes gene_type:complete